MTNPNPVLNLLLYHAASSYYSMIARYALTLSGQPFESHMMDIHKKREQLQPWYAAINPAMTVPTLVHDGQVLGSSDLILQYLVNRFPATWFETDASEAGRTHVQQLVDLHYQFAVERLTFNAIMQKLPPVRIMFPVLLRKACRELEQQLNQANQDAAVAIQQKLELNRQRLAYFAEPLAARQAKQIELAKQLINTYPDSPQGPWLFGKLPSRADVVLLVFLARLNSVGLNNESVVPPELSAWFQQKTQTQAFVDADVWVKFHPWRLLTHR
ncbi:glutathione S-transferase family protein [Orrella daihaiensis]|uniref:Glutathione S-transferase family protein n=1 Tax=Orrella daihaiensis TaxID=2782176 RepID=A0ABY4ALU0_9BURK|nr:glutathione S-transferase family protein [Orrella daihaiensis]UOD50913.1 glutathione S-transferase family protein [Orrella daihaiensis]